MDANTMKLVLDYVYTGQACLSEDSVQNLLSASNLFQVSFKNTATLYTVNYSVY